MSSGHQINRFLPLGVSIVHNTFYGHCLKICLLLSLFSVLFLACGHHICSDPVSIDMTFNSYLTEFLFSMHCSTFSQTVRRTIVLNHSQFFSPLASDLASVVRLHVLTMLSRGFITQGQWHSGIGEAMQRATCFLFVDGLSLWACTNKCIKWCSQKMLILLGSMQHLKM